MVNTKTIMKKYDITRMGSILSLRLTELPRYLYNYMTYQQKADYEY
jgi:hypothetical protein